MGGKLKEGMLIFALKYKSFNLEKKVVHKLVKSALKKFYPTMTSALKATTCNVEWEKNPNLISDNLQKYKIALFFPFFKHCGMYTISIHNSTVFYTHN